MEAKIAIRDIKFKVWDKISYNWVHLDYIELKRESSHVFKINIRLERMMEMGMIRNIDDFEIVDYVGVKDINGVEIYVGSILKSDSGISEVIFHKGRFTPRTKDNIMGAFFGNNIEHFNYEVIGSVQENPQLLKD